jgi:hypothetical protein
MGCSREEVMRVVSWSGEALEQMEELRRGETSIDGVTRSGRYLSAWWRRRAEKGESGAGVGAGEHRHDRSEDPKWKCTCTGRRGQG